MSLSRYLFGDFQITFNTSLSASAAATRLAAISDQSTFHQAKPELHGYATVGEVVLWEGSDLFGNPFRPHFRGHFLQVKDGTILTGVVRADWRAKVWCACTAAAIPITLLSDRQSQDIRALGALAVASAAFLLLHRSVRPGSRSSDSLSKKIATALAS